MMVNTDQQLVATNWLAWGFSCDLWVDPPGQVWEDYRHVTDELLMPVVGRLELEFEGQCFRPAPGEDARSGRLVPQRQKYRWDYCSMALWV